MDKINFSKNWNNKLACNAFTTLRSYDNKRYLLEKEFEILINGEYLCKAVIVALQSLDISELSDTVAYIDTGSNAIKCANSIRLLYGLSPGVPFHLALITLVKV